MSARFIGRGYGVIVTCNYDGCTEQFRSANVVKKHNRSAAAREGWTRGGGEASQALGRLPDARRRGARADAA